MDSTLQEISKLKLKKPKLFKVVLINDDYTTMDFVIEVLMMFFAKDSTNATALTLKIHFDGEAVCGVYSYDVAKTKRAQVINFSRANNYPLLCVVRTEV